MEFLQFKNPKYDNENVIQKIKFPIVTVIVIDILQYNYAMSACLSLMRDRDHLYLQLTDTTGRQDYGNFVSFADYVYFPAIFCGITHCSQKYEDRYHLQKQNESKSNFVPGFRELLSFFSEKFRDNTNSQKRPNFVFKTK